jgi:uncharacterized membrane protein HdeD (DUF308 family)
MSTTMDGGSTGSILKANWGWLIGIGIVLAIGGLFIIIAPATSSIAITLAIAIALVVAGAVQIYNAFKIRKWIGFAFQLLIGVVALVGGIAVYLQPAAGGVALTVVVAAFLIAHGVAQAMLAFRIRPHVAWAWIGAAGVVGIVVGLMVLFRWPSASLYTLAVLTGISLIATGASYVTMGYFASR